MTDAADDDAADDDAADDDAADDDAAADDAADDDAADDAAADDDAADDAAHVTAQLADNSLVTEGQSGGFFVRRSADFRPNGRSTTLRGACDGEPTAGRIRIVQWSSLKHDVGVLCMGAVSVGAYRSW